MPEKENEAPMLSPTAIRSALDEIRKDGYNTGEDKSEPLYYLLDTKSAESHVRALLTVFIRKTFDYSVPADIMLVAFMLFPGCTNMTKQKERYEFYVRNNCAAFTEKMHPEQHKEYVRLVAEHNDAELEKLMDRAKGNLERTDIKNLTKKLASSIYRIVKSSDYKNAEDYLAHNKDCLRVTSPAPHNTDTTNVTKSVHADMPAAAVDALPSGILAAAKEPAIVKLRICDLWDKVILKHKYMAICIAIIALVIIPLSVLIVSRQSGGGIPHIANNRTLPAIVVSGNAVPDFLVAENFYIYREFDEALSSFTKALDEQIRISGTASIETARVYSALGFTYLELEDYAGSVENLTLAIDIMSEEGSGYWPELGRLYYNRAVAYMALFNPDEAAADLNKSYALINTNIAAPEISDYRSGNYLKTGEMLLARGNPDDALKIMDVALKLKAEYDPKNQAEGVSPVVIPYLELSEDSGTFSFYFADAELAAILCTRGFIYSALNEQEKARRDADIAFGILSALHEPEQRDIWPVYYGILHALAYLNGEIPQALDYASKAVAYAEAGSGRNPFFKGFMYECQGMALDFSARYDEALESHLAAYKIYLALDNERKISHAEQLMKNIISARYLDTDFNDWLAEKMKS